MSGRALLLGHRGARAVAPENTRAGIRRALADGADGVEFDVRQLADGRPVLLHDATLDRTTNASGPLDRLDPARLAAVDAGVGEPLPLLADVLAEFLGRTTLAIEMKETLRAPALDVIARAAAASPDAPLVLASFLPEAVAAARGTLPGVRRALILEPGSPPPAPDAAAELGLWGVFAHHTDATAAYAAEVLGRGLALWVWTVNDPDAAAALVARGASGVITDDPARIRPRLRRT